MPLNRMLGEGENGKFCYILQFLKIQKVMSMWLHTSQIQSGAQDVTVKDMNDYPFRQCRVRDIDDNL